jgi:cyclic beta-1,2-glucan synthetase
MVLAMARVGDGDRAAALMRMLNPLVRTETPAGATRYAIEPYVVAGDVYAARGHEGRGGWSWYTGAASWSYRVALEEILGFEKRGARLRLDPCIPAAWPAFALDYRYGESTYAISVSTRESVSQGLAAVAVDGNAITGEWFDLVDDGAPHAVTILLGTRPSSRT